jgi:hypothetical protein
MVRLGQSKMIFSNRRRSLLLTATRDAIRARTHEMNRVLVLGPKDVDLLLAELIEWRAELAEATTKRHLTQQEVTKKTSYGRRREYHHDIGHIT